MWCRIKYRMLLVTKKRTGKQTRTQTSKSAQFRFRLFIRMRKSYLVNSNSFQRRCVYFSRGTLTFCSQTNVSIRPNPWGERRIGETEGDESLLKSLILRLLTCAFSFLFFCFFWRILGQVFVCTRMSVVCTRMLLLSTRMYSYVSRMLLVWYPYVLVCTRMLPVCTRMSLICHWCGVLVTILVMAVFTLEDEQIVCTDKSSQPDKPSDVKTGRTNFHTTLWSEFVRL